MTSTALRMSIILGWATSISVPLILVLTTIRLLFFPWYAALEYHLPGFPADPYGFTLEDRLLWSARTLEYFNTDASPDYLRQLRFPDGQLVPEPSCSQMDDCQYVYNEREVVHLYDVKVLVERAMIVLAIAAGTVLVSAVMARLQGWMYEYWLAISRGGWMTLVITGVVIAFALLAFGVIFIAFHEVFFTEGTWSFYYSDTLIRLFPERFWRDTFLWVGGIPAIIGVLLGWGIPRLLRK